MSEHQDEQSIRATIAAWAAAIEATDATAIVEAYAEDAVMYGAVPPFRLVGRVAIEAMWAACLPYFPDGFRSEHADLVVDVDRDMAFVTGMHRFIDAAGRTIGGSWTRVSVAYRRNAERWRVVHEHISQPFDPRSGQVVPVASLDAAPGLGCLALDEAAPARDETTPAADDAGQALSALTPHLVCADAAGAIAFYEKALGARLVRRLDGPDGRVWNACLWINGGSIMLNDEMPAMGARGPKAIGGTAVTIHLVVPDVDAAAARATAAGASLVMPPADMFWGDRYGVVEDPFGHRWSLATQIRSMTAEEMQQAGNEMAARMAKA